MTIITKYLIIIKNRFYFIKRQVQIILLLIFLKINKQRYDL